MATYQDQGPARAARRPLTDAELRARRIARVEREAARATHDAPDWEALAAELHAAPVGTAFKVVAR